MFYWCKYTKIELKFKEVFYKKYINNIIKILKYIFILNFICNFALWIFKLNILWIRKQTEQNQ